MPTITRIQQEVILEQFAIATPEFLKKQNNAKSEKTRFFQL